MMQMLTSYPFVVANLVFIFFVCALIICARVYLCAICCLKLID